MKIFHGPQNIGGMAGTLANAQRQLGADAMSYCLPTGNFRYPVDNEIYQNKIIGTSLSAFRAAASSNVLQFYFGESLLLSKLYDVPIWKALGKKIYFYFCGCDARDSKYTIANYPYNACKQCWPMACSANRKKAINMAVKCAHGIMVSTPDLLEFVPNSIWLPQPIEMSVFDQLRKGRKEFSPQGERLVVAHAPSNRTIKGTAFLQKAIQELQDEGAPIDLLMVENMAYDQAMHLCCQADIVVDQLLVGAYGQYAVEMMALGKPVIAYIREDLREKYPEDMPILSANPETIYRVLKNCIDNFSSSSSSSSETGKASLAYAQRVHDSRVVAKKLLDLYAGVNVS